MERYGTIIERGQITEVTGNGCKVRSFDRDGIVTPPIEPITDGTLAVGDYVYFFLFPDGKGRILSRF